MIDEKKLLADLNNLLFTTEMNSVEFKTIEQCIECVDIQPQADKWIPFNEPPKEDDTYIVAWLPIGLDCKARTKHYYALWDFENDEWEVDVPESYKNLEIIGIAWQPLPQAYKKEGAEDERS